MKNILIKDQTSAIVLLRNVFATVKNHRSGEDVKFIYKYVWLDFFLIKKKSWGVTTPKSVP